VPWTNSALGEGKLLFQTGADGARIVLSDCPTRRRTTLISNPGRHSSLALSDSMSRRKKTPISNRGRWSSLNLCRYIHLGECHSKVKHGAWAAAGFVPEMAGEPHYGQRYPRILMEACTGNQETGSILWCRKKQETTTLSPKRAADDR